MDGFREWLSDNLRYILLGLALILVLVIAVVGIRAISNIATGTGSPSVSTQTETQPDTASDVIVETDAAEPASAAGSLVQNDARVLTMMTAYYNARTNGDTEVLRQLNPSMEEQEAANLANSYVEGYENISTYSKPGLTDGSYIVYVCYDGKVKDIDTLVPSLIEFYVMTDNDGNLYIADTEGDAQIKAFCEESGQTPEVQSLVERVSQSLQQARSADPALDDFMKQYGTASQDDGEEKEDESEDEQGTEIVALDSCNIRSEPNTDSDENIIGSLYIGETATKIGETDDGWTQIDFNGETAYVSSEFVATPEEAQAAEEAGYFEPAAAE